MDEQVMKKYSEAIKSLQNKAGLNREICAYQYKKYKLGANSFSYMIIIISAIIALLSIADPVILESLPLLSYELGLKRNIIAFLGFLIFLFSFSDKILGISEFMGKNEQDFKILTSFMTSSRAFRKIGLMKCTEEMADYKIEEIKEQYNQINQMLLINTVSNMTFLKIKKAYLQKMKVSRMLDADPDIDINEYYSMSLREWLFYR